MCYNGCYHNIILVIKPSLNNRPIYSNEIVVRHLTFSDQNWNFSIKHVPIWLDINNSTVMYSLFKSIYIRLDSVSKKHHSIVFQKKKNITSKQFCKSVWLGLMRPAIGDGSFKLTKTIYHLTHLAIENLSSFHIPKVRVSCRRKQNRPHTIGSLNLTNHWWEF